MIYALQIRTLIACALLVVVSTAATAQGNTGWTLAWSDEFSQPDGSSPDPAKWAFDIGATGWGNNEWQYYTSHTNNARIQNGHLVIEAKKETYQGANYTSARLKTQGKASWAYGRIEARLKVPRGQGIWPAFWMLGTNITSVGWPACGEIDIMENIGKEPTIAHGTIHGPGYSGGNGIGGSVTLPGNAPFADDFHVFAVEWTTNSLKWFLDGKQFFNVNPARLPAGANWVFTQPQFLLLNVAVGGNWPGYPDATTVFPQQMLVDYVRVYAPTPLQACSANLLGNPGFETGTLAQWTAYGAGFNTGIENIRNVPTHDGTNVFKLFGQFNSNDNYSGIYQNVGVVPGRAYRAGGWMLTPNGDSIAGLNAAWIELSFRDSSGKVLELYRSASLDASSPVGVWLDHPITNQFNPATFQLIGTVTNLLAPAGAVSARHQVVFRQPQMSAGAVLFDNLRIVPAETQEVPVWTSLAKAPTSLNLSFPTYHGLEYRVRQKSELEDSTWFSLTNFLGDGRPRTIVDTSSDSRRFYQVVRVCN